MEELFKVINLNQNDKIGNLEIEAHSSVKSTKYFPIYEIKNKQYIFKPLSKTKPLTTPLFSYSEVYWSYIINKYFDSKAPRYYLAISQDITKEQPKYYDKGVLVESLTPNNEIMINLFDYFTKYPEESVNIKDYVNYCMKNYDYTDIIKSNFIKNNPNIGIDISYQILLSILRQDQNFHYENINLYTEPVLSIVPPIDFEFSTPFLYPDNDKLYDHYKNNYINSIKIECEEDNNYNLIKQLLLFTGNKLGSINTRNICQIVNTYPDIVLKFINNLNVLIKDLPNIIISDPDNYIDLLNSDYWEVGHAYYKDNDIDKYNELKKSIILKEINKELIFKRISKDILEFSKYYSLILKIYLLAYYNKIENLEELTIKKLLDKLGIIEEVTIEDININTKELKLKKK